MIAASGELNEPAFFRPFNWHLVLLEQFHQLLHARFVARGLVQPRTIHLAPLGAQHLEGGVEPINIFAC